MLMPQLNVSLPDGLKDHVDGVVAKGNYASPSDFIRDLIRQDQDERRRLERLRAEVERGFASGTSGRSLQDIMDDYRKRLEAA